MQYATWAYPWDLLDEGVEVVADRLIDMGITELNLATHYHTVQAFLPHNPERRTFFSESACYYQADGRYAGIEPPINDEMGEDDWVATVTDRLSETPVDCNSWTIGCHNTVLGTRHPELTQTTAHDDDLRYALCPSNPTVREYLVDLLTDLDGRNAFRRIELESFDFFYGTGFGWHHDKYHVDLGALGEFLFGLCFCDHCRERAETAGIDVDAVRRTVRETLDRIANGRFDGDRTDVRGWLTERPAVDRYVDSRSETLRSLFERFESTVSGSDLGYYTGLLSATEQWKHGGSPETLAPHLDYLTAIAYESSREDAVAQVSETKRLAPDARVDAGVLPGHPHVHDGETLTSILDGLDGIGVERVSFYNYGLLPERNLEWIETSIDAIESP